MSNKIQTLPNIYVRKATGKIQEWSIYVIKNSDKDVWLITEYGQIGGKKVTHKKQIKSTKSKRSPYDEAEAQAKNKWNEKVNKEGYVEDPKKAQEVQIVRPMLANKFNFEGKSGIEFPCIIEEKCDGNRAIVYRSVNRTIIESRNGTETKFFDHIRKDCEKFLEKMLIYMEGPVRLYLDGELYTDKLTFNVINGLCNKTTILSGKEEKYMSKIKYYIFDCFDLNHMDMKLIDRKKILEKTFSSDKFPNLVFVRGELISSKDEIKKKHDEYTARGYEGAMLRNLNSQYELKKRSKHLQKYKVFIEEEFDIIGYKEADDDKGTVVWVCKTNIKPETEFTVKPKGDTEYRAALLNSAKNYIGSKLTVIFQEYTDNIHGIPRFPVGKDFRYSKDLS